MGLDNGIELRSKRELNIPPELVRVRNNLEYYEHDDYPCVYNICYWRKCWNIRHAIGIALKVEDFNDVGKEKLTINDVKNIWHVINYLNCKKVWDETDSIWSYKEIRGILDDDLLALEWLIQFMHDDTRAFANQEVYVDFYDSY